MELKPGHPIYYVGFRKDNTEGYSQEERDQLNAELTQRLRGIRAGSLDWWETAREFADEVARR